MQLAPRLGWALAGALALAMIATLARVIQAGPIDPPGPVGSTMKTLADLLPAWDQTLTSSGCGSARWTCVMGGDAVLDNETGLVWQKTPIYPSGASPLPWSDARSSCESTVVGSRLGWRLPTDFELEALIDGNTGNLVAGHPFTAASPGEYWTSTTDVADNASAEAVSFGGFFGWTHAAVLKTLGSAAGAWCVRGQGGADPAPPQDVSSWWRWNMPANDGFDSCHSSRFECTMSNAAVLDHMTGLVWTRDVNAGSNSIQSYTSAILLCGSVRVSVVNGWRLPTFGELSSLLDTSFVSPDLSMPVGNPFQNVGTSNQAYWTSTPTTNGFGVAVRFTGISFQGLHFPGGGIELNRATDSAYVWCVRGPG